MGELKDKFNKMKGKRNQAGSPPYYVNEILEDIVDKVESGTGTGTGSSTYPIEKVVLDENTQSVTLKPNVFYNLENNTDNEIDININPEELYNLGDDKILLLSFDDVDQITSLFLEITEYIGIKLKPDTSKEGYKYKSVIDLTNKNYGIVTLYVKEYPTTGSNAEFCISNDVLGLSDYEITLTNLIVYNEDINTIMQHNFFGGGYAIMIEEEENDNLKFKHKYRGYGLGQFISAYTMDAYPNINVIYYNPFGETNEDDNINVVVFQNPIEASTSINEFIININTPANIVFNLPIKWHNDNVPDLTKEGIYTISIVNGVGCYTFVNK